MIFSKLKIWLAVAVAAVISVLGAALKIRTAQYKKEKKKATVATERADRVVEVITRDAELDEQADMHLAEVVHGSSDELTNPNDWD